jgi:hypothetical protein
MTRVRTCTSQFQYGSLSHLMEAIYRILQDHHFSAKKKDSHFTFIQPLKILWTTRTKITNYSNIIDKNSNIEPIIEGPYIRNLLYYSTLLAKDINVRVPWQRNASIWFLNGSLIQITDAFMMHNVGIMNLSFYEHYRRHLRLR